jgi:hypothetical protein
MARNAPVSGFPLLVYKLRHGGIGWLFRRLRQEWRMPRTEAGQTLYRAVRAAVGAKRSGAVVVDRSATLHAFYDLGVAPVTFDFLWFLVGAELERQRRGLAQVHVVIVPGSEAGLRREDSEYETKVDRVARRQRITDILVPACTLLPNLSDVTVADSRNQARDLVGFAGDRVFPRRYEPDLPRYPGPLEPLRSARAGTRIGVLRATHGDLAAVERWLQARGATGRLVTITLRNYGFMPARNSNLAAWTEFARRLDRRYSPVFVPDTSQCFDGLPAELGGLRVFDEAALSVGLRAALYERAFVNLGVNNGPMGLCWLNDRTAYITFKMLTDDVPQTAPEYMEHLGFEIGASLPGATPVQKWVWEDDDLPVIEREFAAMVARLEKAVDRAEAVGR